jgi:hypothetical protein
VLDQREWVVGLGCVAGIAAACAWLARRRRGSDGTAHPCYARALRLLARRGFVRARGVTARGFAREVGARLPASAGTAFAELTEAYLRERFGARAADGAGALARFEQAIAARGGLRPSS